MENIEQISTENIRQKVSDYQNIIKVFADLLSAENSALREFDMNKVGELFEKKAHVVGVYRGLVAFFIKHKDYLDILERDERTHLKEDTAQLDKLLQENNQLLKTRMQTSQTVMDSIISYAKAANNANATSYGSQGKYSPQDNSKNAIAINRTL